MADEVQHDIESQPNDLEVGLLAKDLSAFLHVNTTSQAEDVTNIIDGILAKLEEFCTVIELIRMESKDVLFTTMPILHERCTELKPIFEQIQHLESFVNVVRNCVEDAEEKVRIAEKELGSKNLKKIMQTVRLPKFFARNKEIQPYLKGEISSEDYNPPKTFNTDDYFKK